MKDVKGKTAFITGGASGIGLGMARAFGLAGMNVMLADLDQAKLNAAVEGLKSQQIDARAVVCDVTSRGEVQRAALQTIDAFGKVHVVCNNAGVGAGGTLGEVEPRNWDWVIDVNLKGVYYGVETFAPLIKSHGEGGHIVNTASMLGLVTFGGVEPYTATKYAVVGMSEGWRQQLEPFNIGMSVLCPSWVRTGIAESGRNRTTAYGGAVEPQPHPISDMVKAAIAGGFDPDIVGERVLEAIRANELYIIVGSDIRAMVEARFKAILEGCEASERSPALMRAKKQVAP